MGRTCCMAKVLKQQKTQFATRNGPQPLENFGRSHMTTESTSVSELGCPGQRLCFECGTLSPNSINHQLSILPRESSSIFGIGLILDFQHTGIRERQQRSSLCASRVGWPEAVRSMPIYFLSPRWSHLGAG
jgi:hypothetical protein